MHTALERIGEAAVIAFPKAVRTFAQSMTGGLGAVTIAALTPEAMKYTAGIAILVTIGSGIAALAAFFQNLAENLPE